MRLLQTAIAATVLMSASAFAANPVVNVDTNMGDFKLELYPDKAPRSVENFLKYVNDGSYVGTQFHRVIPGFVVQGGGFDTEMNQLPTSYGEVINESKNGLSNSQATIAMARTNKPHSATRQFYINLENNSSLDARGTEFGYAVFGKVTQGFDVVQKIATQKTGVKKGMRDVPNHPILIEKISVENSAK